MSCNGQSQAASTVPVRTLKTEKTLVFTKGGNAPGTSSLFVLSPLQMTEIAPMLLGIRVTVIIDNATTDFMSRAAFQTTDDGGTWDSAVYLEPAMVGDDRRTTTAWYTDTSSFKRGIRVGLFVSQEAGINVVQMAQAQLIIDLLLRS